jgi:outer membrane protein
METGNYNGWNAALTLKFPLQNRQALAQYSQKQKALEQGKVSLDSLKEMIRLETRSAIRALETGSKLITAYDANVKSEEAKLDAQVKRYNVGFATIFEVLTFQEDLATAQANYLQSLVAYQKALIELQRVKASFLQDYRVQFLDKPVQERLARENAGK